ncbi:MAG: type I-U CRISPR-associated helicase/endonuclease Cas3, partial [Acidobacteria bacterium]|nr:type I-U CRISPR-associated helicase/endonuclease Cas3 [Acidobacteriota bacterium]
MPPTPVFPEFYRALNARDPFPWQRRLAEHVAATEQWPADVGVPTGLGKTACLDIAVWWLASQADRQPADRAAPTRIWWVVNRRLLVDSTADHAERIARVLGDPDAANLVGRDREVVASIAHRLRSLSADPGGSPLEVIRLRGGVASRTPADPSQPAVLLCTLPMYGSRLLFRGYGSNQRLRVVDAAMAGTDSLVLLDEAHLAPHLRASLPALAACTPHAEATLGQARSNPKIASLTATGDAADGQRFDLDDEDRAHPVVRQRLDAAKPLDLRVETGDSAKRLADAALNLLQQAPRPAACVVFTNTPKTARETFDRLGKLLPEGAAELLLLTGLTREREAEQVRARILNPEHGMAAARAMAAGRQRHLVVVATQTLEVGADIDAEYLVTEACGVRALTQRLGRLNRLGRFPHARAAYVHLPPPKPQRGRKAADPNLWPVYGCEPASVLERLREARDPEGSVSLSPRAVTEVLGPPRDLRGRAPEILPGILWEWTKTTTPPEGEAPVEPYFSGIAGPQYSVSLIWRVHVPEDGERLWPRATDREAVDVPLAEVRAVLGDDEFRRLAFDGVTVETTSG